MSAVISTGDSLFELVDQISKSEKLMDGHELLRQALNTYGLDHVVYIAVNLPTEKRDRPLVAMTYSPEWQKHYAQRDYVDIDPVVRAGIGGILPVDWATLDRAHPTVRKFFGEAQEFKVGSQGISVPVRGRHGEFALFSVTSAMDDREWEKLKQRYMRDFMLLAYNFHAFALNAEQIEPADDYRDKLSFREVECLRWTAMGKSAWDTGQIMGVSERTVKFHLENARAKLRAMNTTHAVSKALSLSLITLY
ncbi:MAG: LuxR family transcriptional regulator [Bauldia sp.]